MLKNSKRLVLLILGFIAFVGYYFLNRYYGLSVPCVFYEITGFYCPGCGITRMFFSLLKLDFYQAFRYNPLVYIMFVVYVSIKIYELINKEKVKIPEKVYYVLLVVVIIYGIIRNIPLFDFLQPTVI